MRTISQALNTALQRTDGAEFRWLVDIMPSGGAARHLCADAQIVGGVTYAAELLAIAPMYESISSVGDLTIEVADNAANRAAIVLAADITVSLWHVGSAAADKSILFHGEISDPIARTAGKISADAVSFAALDHRMVGVPVSKTEFPGADPDAIGQVKPVIYGQVSGLRCLNVDAGSITTLQAAVNATVTSLPVTDAAAFPATGTIQCDIEEISYTGKTATTLTGCTRGINATVAAPHDKSATVAEVQNFYDYLVADHPVKAIANVYVDGVRQSGADFAFFLNLGGQSFVRFYTLPTIVRQVNLIVDDKLTVTDTASIVDGIEVLDANPTVIIPALWSTSASPSKTSETDLTISAVGGGQSLNVNYLGQTFIQSYFPAKAGGVTTYDCNLYVYNAARVAVRVGAGAWLYVLGTATTDAPFSPGIISVTLTSPTPETVIEWSILWYSGNVSWQRQAHTRTITNIPVYVTTGTSGMVSKSKVIKGGTGVSYAPGVVKGGTIGLIGNSVADTKIGGIITVDVQGWQDDASGTITSTPNALIEQPNHITRHLLIHYGGVAPAGASAADFANFPGDRMRIFLQSVRSLRSLVTDIARQSNSITTYSAGRWIMRRQPSPGAAPVATLTDAETMRLESGASTLVEGVTGLRLLKNRHRWRCGQAPAGKAWVASGVVESAASQASYRIRESIVDLPFVPIEVQAIVLVTWLAAREANPLRKVIHFQALLSSYALEIADVVRIINTQAGIDVTGNIISIGPRVLSGRGNGSMTITIEED